jgi:hypothetical protein
VFAAHDRGAGADHFHALDVLPAPPLLATGSGVAAWLQGETVYRWSAGRVASWALPADHAGSLLLALSPDGQRLYTQHPKLRGFFVWSAAGRGPGERVMTESFVDGYLRVVWSPCGRWLAAGGPGRGVVVYDLRPDRIRRQVVVPFEGGTPSVFGFSPDGEKLAAHVPETPAGPDAKGEEMLRVWAVAEN